MNPEEIKQLVLQILDDRKNVEEIIEKAKF
jgi:hypothetical protein